jgi:hypothetical protein
MFHVSGLLLLTVRLTVSYTFGQFDPATSYCVLMTRKIAIEGHAVIQIINLSYTVRSQKINEIYYKKQSNSLFALNQNKAGCHHSI